MYKYNMKLHQLFLLVTTLSVTALMPSHAESLSPIGTWSNVGNVGTYVNPANGQVLGTSAAAHHVTLNADGSYQKTDYYQFNDCKWFQHSGTYEIQEDRILFNPEEYNWAICGNPAGTLPLETQTFRWRFHEYNDGIKLELLSSNSTQDWGYAEALSRQE
jgi:hypothetical protein